MAATLVAACGRISRTQNFRQAIGETRSSQNLRHEKKRAARIGAFRNGQERSLQVRIGRELPRAGV